MIEYLTVEQVIEIHDEMIKRYGGLQGIRDKNLLWSAVDAPKAAMFGQKMYPSIYQCLIRYNGAGFSISAPRIKSTILLTHLTHRD